MERLHLALLGRQQLRRGPGILDRLPRRGELDLLHRPPEQQHFWPAVCRLGPVAGQLADPAPQQTSRPAAADLTGPHPRPGKCASCRTVWCFVCGLLADG
jgi:hypothetical protein